MSPQLNEPCVIGPHKGKKGKGKGASLDACQVYVGNLSYETSWQDLKDHMARCGEVAYCDTFGSYGLVRYWRRGDALNAIDELTETKLDGRRIFVREDRDGGKI